MNSPIKAEQSVGYLIGLLGNSMLYVCLPPAPAHSMLFACNDSPGVTIVTDNPTQLGHCRPLNESTAPSPSSGPTVSSPQPMDPLAKKEGRDVDSPALAVPVVDVSKVTPVVSIPLERSDALFVITIQVNKTRTARVIVDTGASHTILSHAIARDLGLFSHRPVASGIMHTAGGPIQSDMFAIDSIQMADAEVQDTVAAIHDLPEAPSNIDGLLGLNVLRQFDVTLDTSQSRLHLTPKKP